MTSAPQHGDVLDALQELERALERVVRRSEQMSARLAQLCRDLQADRPLAEVVSQESKPLIVELITECIRELQDAGVELRRAEARALRSDGLSIEAIAGLFGVSRQRVSALLRDP